MNWLVKIIKQILALFYKTAPPTPPAPLSIPYPEEEMRLGQKVSDVNVPSLKENYYHAYSVPPINRETLDKVRVNIEDQTYYPAYTAGMTITMNPQWANIGVLAHEMAHVIYFQYLSGEDTIRFAQEYNALILTDPLLILLDSKNSYMNINYIEGHAEVYRYLGKYMPSALKKYYPLLF
jgi:hypothetical protein